MQVEKMEERTQMGQMRSMAEFQEVVRQLWDNHVRTELIYGKKLRFCKTCFVFYYQTDPEADHPVEDSESVQKFFGEAGITSLSRLVNFLWNAYSRVSGFQPVLANMMTAKHRPATMASQQTFSLLEMNSLYAKLALQQSQLAEATKKVEELETERNLLLKENEEMMEELLKTRTQASQDFSRIHRLCAQIGTLCHPKECCCPDEERPK
jgi:hypothetical protein